MESTYCVMRSSDYLKNRTIRWPRTTHGARHCKLVWETRRSIFRQPQKGSKKPLEETRCRWDWEIFFSTPTIPCTRTIADVSGLALTGQNWTREIFLPTNFPTNGTHSKVGRLIGKKIIAYRSGESMSIAKTIGLFGVVNPQRMSPLLRRKLRPPSPSARNQSGVSLSFYLAALVS